jgi:FMN reductase
MAHRTIVVVSGGLRSPSSTRLLADQLGEASRVALESIATSAAPVPSVPGPADTVEVRLIELREHAHAITDALLTGFPTGALKSALADVLAAHALVVVSPVFQASYGGLFKSFMDLVEAGSIRGMPVLLAATGGTERHSLVIDHALRPLFSYLGALTVPTGVYAATSDFGGAGSADLAARIERAAAELAALVARGPSRPSAATPLVPFAELLAGVARPDSGAR